MVNFRYNELVCTIINAADSDFDDNRNHLSLSAMIRLGYFDSEQKISKRFDSEQKNDK